MNRHAKDALRIAGLSLLYISPAMASLTMTLAYVHGGMRLSWWAITAPLWVYVTWLILIAWVYSVYWMFKLFFEPPKYPRRYRRM